MKYIPIIITVFLLLSIPTTADAQFSKVDSLRKLVAQEINESRKTDLLYMLSVEYRQINSDSSHYYSEQLVQIAEKNKNQELKFKAQLNQVYYYISKSKAEEGLQLTEKNIILLNKYVTNDSLLAQYYSVAGLALMRLNRQKDAMEQFFQALRSSDKAKDYTTKAKAEHNVGWAYMELNQFREAIRHFSNSVRILNEHMQRSGFGVTYTNLGSCYGSLRQYDSVYLYASKGIQIAKKENNIPGEANAWNVLGTAYMQEKKYDKALECFLKSAPLRKITGDYFFIVSDLAVLSELHALMGNSAKGIEVGKDALKIALEKKLHAKLPMIYKAMALNFEVSGDYYNAAEIYKQINFLKDSLYNNASSQALAEMQTKYETEKKERIIQEQKYSLRQKNYFLGGIAVLLLFSMVLAYLIIARNKMQQQATLQAAVFQQKQQATAAIMQAEENERQRIAKDLHDGVGQMMSAAKMNLSAFGNEINFLSPDQKISFERIISLVDESCKEVRTVSHQMMPNMLLKSGLGKAVSDFIDKIDQRIIKIHLYTEGLQNRLDEQVEIVIFRVLQESVNNVIKHSGASKLDISLVHDATGIRLSIEDNGKGFLSSATAEQEGIGLKNMKARVVYLNGTIDIDSSPGRGTLIAVFLPGEQKKG